MVDMDNWETTGDRIRKLRKRKGLTQQSLANKLGVDIKTERKWEKDESTPSYGMIDQMCRILKCDPDYLFFRCDDYTHELTDIKNITGLSEGSIMNIKETHNISILSRETGETSIDCINWFLENGLLSVLGVAWISRKESEKYESEREAIPKELRDLIDRASLSLKGVTPGDDFKSLLRSAMLRELRSLTDDELMEISKCAFFNTLNDYNPDSSLFSNTAYIYTLPKKGQACFQKYGLPMACLIVDKEFEYMMYMRERDLRGQVLSNKIVDLINQYMKR